MTAIPACACRQSFRDEFICMLTLGPCVRAQGAACPNRAASRPAKTPRQANAASAAGPSHT